MKKTLRAIAKNITIISGGIFVLSSCVTDPDSPGLEYTPDMYRSPAIEIYVDYAEVRGIEHKDWKVKQSALRPPHNTIPYYGKDEKHVGLMLPYHRLASSAAPVSHGLLEREGWRISESDDVLAEYNAAANDKHPFPLSPENKEAIFDEGKQLYTSMCAHCHGEKGDGEGPMVKSGAYAGVPNYANLQDLSDGQVFYSIYYGKGSMGAHSMLLDKKEIWTLVHYVNKFRFEDYGDFEKATDENTEEETEEAESEENNESAEETEETEETTED
jgi:mono/diheme cytochrome c family protein